MKFAINNSKFTEILVAIAIAIIIVISHRQPSAAQAQNPPAKVVIDGNGSMTPQGTNDPHIRLSLINSPAPEDSDKANRVAQQLKQAISKYAQVQDAVEAGYLKFPANPDKNLKIIHYVHPWLSYLENFRLKPEQPGALLYQKQGNGQLQLLGAMYTAPAESTMEQLNDKIPLSVTRWHLHTNMCLPEPIWDEQQWQRQRNGRPVFGPKSPIATQAGCERVNGKFKPNVFGWMVHVNTFASNPEDVFNYQYDGRGKVNSL